MAGLALGEGVGAPFADATGVEVVIAAPAAADVGGVVGPPGAGAQPGVPVHLVLGRLGLGGQPVVAHLGGVPRGDVGVGGVDLAQPAGAGHLDGEDVSWPRSAAACRSGRRGRSAGRSPPPPGPRRWSCRRASRCRRPCRRAWPGSTPARASGRRWRSARASMSVRAARNSRMSRYMAQSLLPYLVVHDPLDGLALGFLASQMATNCTSCSGSIQLRSSEPRLPMPMPPSTIRSLGGTAPFRPKRGGGNEAGRGDRAAGKRGALEKLPAGEGSQAGSGWWMGGLCELREAHCVETWAEPSIGSSPSAKVFGACCRTRCGSGRG